jgi:hypothetical protein
MVWGLTPHEIHSLVGCSTDMEMYPFRVIDQISRSIVHQQSRLECSEFRYNGAWNTMYHGHSSE